MEYDKVIEQLNTGQKAQQRDYVRKALEAKQEERDRCQKAKLDLYPDWKADIITQEEYLMLKANLNDKIEKLNEEIEKLQQSQDDSVLECNGFVEHFKQYKNIDKLTRPMLIELIDSILVHEDNRITIKVKFLDALEQILTFEEENKSA